MSLKESLRKAQEQGKDAANRVLGQAREQWEDAQRRIRASMRIYPRPKLQSSAAKSSLAVEPSNARMDSADPGLNEDMKKARAAAAQSGRKSEFVTKRKDVA